MKYFLSALLIAILVAIGIGFYFRIEGDEATGDKIIGISILASVFILLPAFLYHRWKGKKLSDYTLTKENMQKMKDRGLD